MNDVMTGQWIFLAHSTKDWNQVRKVRNLLEDQGHKPLVFFLKCLTEHSELDELIKREIDSRNWFLLCASENAKNSHWVQAEIAYIKQIEGKYHEEIDLNGPIESQIFKIDRLCKRINVFMVYAHTDRTDARRISHALSEQEYSVWFDEERLLYGVNWEQELARGIDAAVRRGFVIVLLSPDFVRGESRYVQHIRTSLEAAALRHGAADIIPITLRDLKQTYVAMDDWFSNQFWSLQAFDFSRGDFDSNILKLISHMKNQPMD